MIILKPTFLTTHSKTNKPKKKKIPLPQSLQKKNKDINSNKQTNKTIKKQIPLPSK